MGVVLRLHFLPGVTSALSRFWNLTLGNIHTKHTPPHPPFQGLAQGSEVGGGLRGNLHCSSVLGQQCSSPFSLQFPFGSQLMAGGSCPFLCGNNRRLSALQVAGPSRSVSCEISLESGCQHFGFLCVNCDNGKQSHRFRDHEALYSVDLLCV